ncbi:MAG TPA: M20 family metallopeptidase [Thermaerobacter sp.]
MTDATLQQVVQKITDYLESRREAMISLLAELVNLDSPSDDKALLDACATRLAAELAARGCTLERVPARAAGDHLIGRFGSAATRPEPRSGGDGAAPCPAGGRVLLLAHYDTVWPAGEARRRPFRREGRRGFGPGAFDMKGGIVIGLFALEALAAIPESGMPRPGVTFLLTSDEEVGSTTSRPLIERLAREHAAVLVLEPAAGGRLKIARKGVGDFVLRVRGREAHAGNDPERGVSAVEELARQVLRLHALTDPGRGTTVNVGVIRGGLRPNVIAGAAEAQIDVRVSSQAEAARILELFRSWQPVLPGARVTIEGDFNRPPMEPTPANLALLERARAVGRLLGLELAGASVGGASDGNFTSALGVPTLDGLGATGDGAHAPDEHVLLDELPVRAALLAGLLADLAARPPGPTSA